MKTHILAPLLLLLVGCGGYPCATPWGAFDSETPQDCASVARDFALVRTLMTTIPGTEAPWQADTGYSFFDATYPRGALLSPPAFDAFYAEQVVHVVDAERITCPQVYDLRTKALGCYDPITNEIFLAANTIPLQHEMLHALDHGTSGHRGWTGKGYYGLAEAYMYFRTWGR